MNAQNLSNMVVQPNSKGTTENSAETSSNVLKPESAARAERRREQKRRARSPYYGSLLDLADQTNALFGSFSFLEKDKDLIHAANALAVRIQLRGAAERDNGINQILYAMTERGALTREDIKIASGLSDLRLDDGLKGLIKAGKIKPRDCDGIVFHDLTSQ